MSYEGIDCFGVEYLIDGAEKIKEFESYMLEKGHCNYGYSGRPYLNYHYGDVQFIAQVEQDEEGDPSIIKTNIHARGSVIWPVRIERWNNSDDSTYLDMRVICCPIGYDHEGISIDIYNADMLPCVSTDEIVKLQIIALPTHIAYYADEKELLDSGLKVNVGTVATNTSVKGERKSTVICGKVKSIENGPARKSRKDETTYPFLDVIIETDLGEIEICHTRQQVEISLQKNIEVGSIICGEFYISGDAGIDRYEHCIPQNVDDNLRVVRDVILGGDAGRLYDIIDRNRCVYHSHTKDKEYHGYEEVANLFTDLSSAMDLSKLDVHYAFVRESLIEGGYEPGHQCLIIEYNNQKGDISALFLEHDENQKIKKINIVSVEGYKFVDDYQRWNEHWKSSDLIEYMEESPVFRYFHAVAYELATFETWKGAFDPFIMQADMLSRDEERKIVNSMLKTIADSESYPEVFESLQQTIAELMPEDKGELYGEPLHPDTVMRLYKAVYVDRTISEDDLKLYYETYRQKSDVEKKMIDDGIIREWEKITNGSFPDALNSILEYVTNERLAASRGELRSVDIEDCEEPLFEDEFYKAVKFRVWKGVGVSPVNNRANDFRVFSTDLFRMAKNYSEAGEPIGEPEFDDDDNWSEINDLLEYQDEDVQVKEASGLYRSYGGLEVRKNSKARTFRFRFKEGLMDDDKNVLIEPIVSNLYNGVGGYYFGSEHKQCYIWDAGYNLICTLDGWGISSDRNGVFIIHKGEDTLFVKVIAKSEKKPKSDFRKLSSEEVVAGCLERLFAFFHFPNLPVSERLLGYIVHLAKDDEIELQARFYEAVIAKIQDWINEKHPDKVIDKIYVETTGKQK